MEYKGKLYGKVGNSYFPLTETTEDIENIKLKNEYYNKLLDKIERYEKLGFSSEYIHVALKEYIKGAQAFKN